MPKREEYCEVEVDGQLYRDWTDVSVDRGGHLQGLAIATLATVERDAKGKRQASSAQVERTMRLRPGQKCTVKVAGYRTFNGFICNRQSSYTAANHGVRIIAYAAAGDILHSSVPMKDTQFKDYTFEPIAKKLLEPFKLKLKIENAGQDISKKFRYVAPIPGETVWRYIDRLARMRGLRLRSGEDNDVIAGKAGEAQATVGDLVEGKNILSSMCEIDDRAAFGKIDVLGQQKGGDNLSGDDARKPAAFIEGDSDRYKYKLTIAEEPGDKTDMATRATREGDQFNGAQIRAQVQVQGWLKNSGEIWREFERVKIVSPMHLLDHVLGVAQVQFRQDQSGTTTNMTLVRWQTMGGINPPGITAGEGGVLPGGEQKKGVPDE